jgi:hypothetical protein
MGKSTVRTGKIKRKANKGSFKPGFDVRRHCLTQDERRLGYRNAPSYIRSRIRSLYRRGDIQARYNGERYLNSPEVQEACERAWDDVPF